MKKTKAFVALLLTFLILLSSNGMFVFAYDPSNAPITFKDSKLYDALILSGVDVNEDAIITEDEMANQYSLYLGGSEISDLSGLEYAVNLVDLNLSSNSITDISPLSSLTNLASLELYFNEIVNVSPLSTLTNLTYLDLEGNLISDASGLKTLTGLQFLDISNNSISDISTWNELSSLSFLDIGYNKISDITVLSNFIGLTNLDITENPVTTLAPLKELNIMSLYVTLANITDTASLKDIVKISTPMNSFNLYKGMNVNTGLIVMPYGDINSSLAVEDFTINNSNEASVQASIIIDSLSVFFGYNVTVLNLKAAEIGSSEVTVSIPKYEKEVVISVNASAVPAAPEKTVEKLPILSQKDGKVGAILPDGSLWEWSNDGNAAVKTMDNAKKYIANSVYRCNNNKVYSTHDFSSVITTGDELWAWGNINSLSENQEPTKVTDNVQSADGTFAFKKDGSLWNWGSSDALVKVADNVKSYAVQTDTMLNQMGSTVQDDNDSSLVYLDNSNSLYTSTKVWDENGGFTYSNNKIMDNVRFYTSNLAINDSNELFNITTEMPTPIKSNVKSVSLDENFYGLYRIAFVITQNNELFVLQMFSEVNVDGKDIYSFATPNYIADDIARVEGDYVIKTDNSLCGIDYDGWIYSVKTIETDVDKVYSNGFNSFFTKPDGTLYRIDVTYDDRNYNAIFTSNLILDNVKDFYITTSDCYALKNNGELVLITYDYFNEQWNNYSYLNGVVSAIISDAGLDRNYAILKDGSIWYWGASFNPQSELGFDYDMIPVKMTDPNLYVDVIAMEVTLKTAPTKASYVEGTSLDVSGGVLSVKLNDGSTIEKEITIDMCSGYDMNVLGEQTVTVTYNGFTASFDITVNSKSISNISIKSEPTKTTYVEGNSIDVTGGEITVHYDNGTSEDKEITADMCSGYNMNSVSTQAVTVNYNGKTTSFNITVDAKVVSSIEMKANPTKIIYLANQDLDVNGGKIKVNYDNGTSVEMNITTSMVSDYDKTNIAEQTITVTYDSKTTTFNVTVVSREKVDKLIADITALPEVSTLVNSDSELVYGLRDDYNALTLLEKQAITNLSKLNDAVAKIDTLLNASFTKNFDESSIIASAAAGVIPFSASLNIEQKETTSEILSKVNNKFGSNSALITLLDISLTDNLGNKIQPNGKVTIKVKLSDSLKNETNLKVIYIADDGTITDMNAQIVDGYAVFETSHFSNYAVVKTVAATIPNTNDAFSLFAMLILVFLSGILLVYVFKALKTA